MPESFEDFMRRREAASNDYIQGDAQAVETNLTRQDPATFMPPGGAVVEGSDPVRDAHVQGAAAFGPGSTGRFEILNSGSSGMLAWWTGRQVATMHLSSQDDPVGMTLRTTEVFRLEDDAWRLVHRHADVIAPA